MRDMVMAQGGSGARSSTRSSRSSRSSFGRSKVEQPMQKTLTSQSSNGQGSEALNSSRHEEVLNPALDFVDRSRFQTVISAMIGANVLVLITETDHPDWSCFYPLDIFFAVVFLLEIVLRMAHRGILGFFAKDAMWGVLDVIIVVQGVFGSIILPVLQSRGALSRSGQSSILKCVRLFRLLRMLRFVKLFPKLMVFVQALLGMFGTMVWIFTFLTIIMVCLAIAMTHEIGRRELLEGDLSASEEENWTKVRERFRDVPSSLFTLFRVSTQDDWMSIASPLVDDHPAWSIFFVFFIVFVSWTMISVLTAVASESMVAATTDRLEEDARAKEQEAKAFISFLNDAFSKADIDGNGYLDKAEFEAMMNKDAVAEAMRNAGFEMSGDEIVKAWDMLDIERSGELSIYSFVSGLSYLSEKLTTRHVMNIAYLCKKVSRRLDVCFDDVSLQLERLKAQNEAIHRCMLSQDALKDENRMYTWLWYQWMRKRDPKIVKDVKLSRPAKRQEL